MIDENELLVKIEPLKRAAKIPPIVESGRYQMIVPYVDLVKVIRDCVIGGDKDAGKQTATEGQ